MILLLVLCGVLGCKLAIAQVRLLLFAFPFSFHFDIISSPGNVPSDLDWIVSVVLTIQQQELRVDCGVSFFLPKVW